MRKTRKFLILGAMVTMLGATSLTAFATSIYQSPAEALAGLTGQTVESVIAERSSTDKTYGTLASEAGKLAEFKAEVLQLKKDALAKKVTAGTMTQERADQITAALESNQADCDGTGTAKIGQKMGAGFGGMMGNGQGKGISQGQGLGGMNRGAGNGGGACLAQ